MRRGRWVVYFIAFFLLSSFFSLLSSSSYAASLSMTATVPLSSVWKESLQINSTAKIDVLDSHILHVLQYSLGIEKLPVEKQIIQLLVFNNNVLVHEQIQQTNKKGEAHFTYNPKKAGEYSVFIVNISEEQPFIVGLDTVSL